jgi:hypothetical protein
LPFSNFQSIGVEWDSSTGFKLSASGDWLICDEKRRLCVLPQCGRRQPSSRHQKNQQRRVTILINTSLQRDDAYSATDADASAAFAPLGENAEAVVRKLRIDTPR